MAVVLSWLFMQGERKKQQQSSSGNVLRELRDVSAQTETVGNADHKHNRTNNAETNPLFADRGSFLVMQRFLVKQEEVPLADDLLDVPSRDVRWLRADSAVQHASAWVWSGRGHVQELLVAQSSRPVGNYTSTIVYRLWSGASAVTSSSRWTTKGATIMIRSARSARRVPHVSLLNRSWLSRKRQPPPRRLPRRVRRS